MTFSPNAIFQRDDRNSSIDLAMNCNRRIHKAQRFIGRRSSGAINVFARIGTPKCCAIRIVAGNSTSGLSWASGILGGRRGCVRFWFQARSVCCTGGEDEYCGDGICDAQVSSHECLLEVLDHTRRERPLLRPDWCDRVVESGVQGPRSGLSSDKLARV
jgi:hypothetical protein